MLRSRPLVAVLNSKPELLDLFAEVVAELGLAVTTFQQIPPIEDTFAVEAFLAEQDPDVIMFDIDLPYEVYLRACEQVRTRFASIPVVVIATNPAQVKAFSRDLAVVEKPFHIDGLAAALRLALAPDVR